MSTSSGPIRTVVLGVGLAGLTFHVPFVLALPDLFSLVGVLERNPKTAEGKVHERFGVSTKIYRSLPEVLEDPNVELVIVGTPNETHFEFAQAALNAGKHVLVDKPVSTTSVEAKHLGELAKSKGLVIYAYQNRHWDGDFLTLQKLLASTNSSESLGDVFEFESRFDRYRPSLKGTWKDEAKPGAGQVFDLGSHLIEQALSLYGRPASVTAFVGNLRGLGDASVDDNFTIHLSYPRNAERAYPLTCTLRSCVLSVRTKQVRYVIRGTTGTYTKCGVDPQEDQMKAAATPEAIHGDEFGRDAEENWGILETAKGDAVSSKPYPASEKGTYVSLFRDLAAAIRQGKQPEISWERATAVIEMVELAHRSAKESCTVEVPKN